VGAYGKSPVPVRARLPGDTAAASAALAAAGQVIASSAPAGPEKGCHTPRRPPHASKGDNAGAARAFQTFASTYPDDPKVTGVLYDLGEALMAAKDFTGASAAYDRCIARAREGPSPKSA